MIAVRASVMVGAGGKKVKRCLMDGRMKRSGVKGKMRRGVSVECGVWRVVCDVDVADFTM